MPPRGDVEDRCRRHKCGNYEASAEGAQHTGQGQTSQGLCPAVWGRVHGGGGRGHRNAAPVGGALKSVQVTEGNVGEEEQLRVKLPSQKSLPQAGGDVSGCWGHRGGFRDKVGLEDTSAGAWKARDSQE